MFAPRRRRQRDHRPQSPGVQASTSTRPRGNGGVRRPRTSARRRGTLRARLVAPLPVTATRDVVLHDTQIAEGEVVVWFTAANRDDAARPAQRTRRHPRPTYTSSGRGGPHRCIGEHLARLEIADSRRAPPKGSTGSRSSASPSACARFHQHPARPAGRCTDIMMPKPISCLRLDQSGR
jgi:hypothetical protein